MEVPSGLRWLTKGPNYVAYTKYFINGNKFHSMKRDVPRKTQNSGVTFLTTINSFISARYHNPIDEMVIYCGVIKNIIEVDY